MKRLRRLDASVTQSGQIVALVLGIVGSLLLGLGMSLFMTELGALLGLSQTATTIIGILLGVPGILLAALAYPAHEYVIKRKREKVAPEIIRLTDELMK